MEFIAAPTIYQNPNPSVPLAAVLAFEVDEPVTTRVEIADADVFYHLQPGNPAAHVYTVACRIASPDPEGQEFTLPAWAPGSYLIREFARHLLVVEALTDDGPQPLRKLDKARWRAPAVDGPLVVRVRVYAFDLSVRGSYLDLDHGFVNGFCLFLRRAKKKNL